MQKRCNKQTPDQKKLQDEQPGIFFKDFICLFLWRGEGRERNIDVWLPLAHLLLRTWPATQADWESNW